MLCANCNTENLADAVFCAECGTRLEVRCESCAVVNPPGSKFCRKCGTALRAPSPAAKQSVATSIQVSQVSDTSAAESLEGERKTVTALFADIKGSTEMMEDLDPEQARAIIDPALKLMIDAVHHFDGYVVQSTGDGIFALLGAPVAHEDHPQRALYAALRMQEELRRYSAKIVADGGTPIQGRVGINTGEVVVRSLQTGAGHAEYTPIGHTTNLASRMQTAAPVGSIVATEETRKLCEGYFILKPLGATRVKGVSEPVNVYEVTGLGPIRTRLQRAAGRGYTKFVGRQREMELMKQAAEQAKAGHGQIVAAMAEAGVGKSRLYFEFKAISQSGWMVLETFSVSHGKASAYLPIIDLLHEYFRVRPEDDPRTRREKVNGKVLTLDRSLEDAIPYLFALLGIVEGLDPLAQMDGQIKKRRTLDSIRRIILRESLNQPLMVIVEDLHWIDDETQAFLNLLADSIANAKILLLVNYRPAEYSHQWGSKTYYTQLRLDPLGQTSAQEMLSTLLGDGAELTRLKQIIIDKTEGNPLFMEEIFQSMLEDGSLQRNGSVKLVRGIDQLRLPATVQGILASRIDRLPAGEKDLLQTLAVIGKEFPLSLARAVSKRPDEQLSRMLNDLQLAEFVYEQPAMSDIEFTFKHALTQEVAYQSVLMERRRILHGQIGAALEASSADNVDDHVAALAHHYGRSANPAKAIEYCTRACQQSVDRASYAEAIAHFETGLARLPELPDDDRRAELELDLRNGVRLALATIKGYGSSEGEQSAARAMALAQRPGINREKSWLALVGILQAPLVRPDVRKGRELANELVARAQDYGNSAYVAAAFFLSAFINMEGGDFELAAETFDRAAKLFKSIAQPKVDILPPQFLELEANNEAVSAWNLWFLGYPARALERANFATARAHELGSKNLLEAVHNYSFEVYHLRREVGRVRESCEATAALAAELGNPFRLAYTKVFLGWADAFTGDLAGGIARMRQGLSDLRATGSGVLSEYFLALIATALGQMGQFEEGLRTIEESFPIIERTGERCYEAEIHRLKGELFVAQDASIPIRAEREFRQAIEISRGQRARGWELRATMSLARLLRDTNRRDEARAMLAEIYNWFTEGFDTADLKDAKALMDELSPGL